MYILCYNSPESYRVKMNNDVLFLSLPLEILEKILLYLDYDSISKLREVCKAFDVIAGTCLTNGFLKVQVKHAKCLKQVKNAIPRRESERRAHKLFSKHDALQGLDTRLSLLKMTYNKYIVSHQCCFIPGKVLDELFSVLNKLNSSCQITSVTTLLQEVRDISSMAMEHFDEMIAPHLDSDSSSFSCIPFGFVSFASSASSFRDSWYGSTHNQSSSSKRGFDLTNTYPPRHQKCKHNFKAIRLTLKQYQKSLMNEKKIRKMQAAKIRYLKSTMQTLNETVQGLSTQTLELSAQLQALRNSLHDSGIHRDITSVQDVAVLATVSKVKKRKAISQLPECSTPKRLLSGINKEKS